MLLRGSAEGERELVIIEGLLATTNADGSPHVAAMGPVVDEQLTAWTLRPYQSSSTFQLLRREPVCVFHVTDDVLPVVRSALGLPHELQLEPHADSGWIIPAACHWYRLQVTEWDVSAERSEAKAVVLDHGQLRPFWGWNRAKHAVLEATILATRLRFVERSQVEADIARLAPAVEKTAGPRERQAWELVQQYVAGN